MQRAIACAIGLLISSLAALASPVLAQDTTTPRSQAKCAEADIDAARTKARADADAAIARQDYGLKCSWEMHNSPGRWDCGIICAASLYPVGEQIKQRDDVNQCQGWSFFVLQNYKNAYNTRLIEASEFPHKDICRPVGDAQQNAIASEELLGTRPSKAVLPSQIDSLATAARFGLVDEVRRRLEAGEPVNAPDKLGFSALQWSAARGYDQIVDMLVTRQTGAKQLHEYETSHQHLHRTPQNLAARYGHPQILKKLASKVYLSFTFHVSTLLKEAANGGHVDIINYLYDELDANALLRQAPGWMKFEPDKLMAELAHNAVIRGHAPLVAELLNRGVDIEATGSMGHGNPMNRSLLLSAIEKNQTNVVRLLVERGAMRDKNTLAFAAFWSGPGVISALIDAGSNPNGPGSPDVYSRRNLSPATPLWFAAGNCHADAQKVKTLISRGADPNRKGTNGQTALHHALDFGMMRDLRGITGLGQKIRPNMPDAIPDNLACVEALTEAGASINEADDDGNTPLHFAARSDYHVKTINLLIKKGADVNKRNAAGATPADVARQLGLERVPILLNPK